MQPLCEIVATSGVLFKIPQLKLNQIFLPPPGPKYINVQAQTIIYVGEAIFWGSIQPTMRIKVPFQKLKMYSCEIL